MEPVCPAAAAALVAACPPRAQASLAGALAGAAVPAGHGFWVDPGRLPAPLAAAACDFTAQARQWRETGRGGDVLTVQRLLRHCTAVDSAGVRLWLEAEKEALQSWPDLELLWKAVTASAPEPDVRHLLPGVPMVDEVEVAKGGTRRVVTVSLDPARAWQDELGGISDPAETARLLQLTVRHAKHRDSAVKRLTTLRAVAQEEWPMPSIDWDAVIEAAGLHFSPLG